MPNFKRPSSPYKRNRDSPRASTTLKREEVLNPSKSPASSQKDSRRASMAKTEQLPVAEESKSPPKSPAKTPNEASNSDGFAVEASEALPSSPAKSPAKTPAEVVNSDDAAFRILVNTSTEAVNSGSSATETSAAVQPSGDKSPTPKETADSDGAAVKAAETAQARPARSPAITSEEAINGEGATVEAPQTLQPAPVSSPDKTPKATAESDEKTQSSAVKPEEMTYLPRYSKSLAQTPKVVNDSEEKPQSSAAKSPKEAKVEAKTTATESIDRYSTKQRRLEYFRSGIDADCEVHVPKTGDQEGGNVCYKKFRCHRIFLATASEKLEKDVFQNMQWNGILQINGVSPDSVEIFLEYIYTFEVTSPLVDLKGITDIYILSTAYNMPEFLQAFGNRLKDKDWPLSDIFPAFNLAFQHNMIELENACVAKILNRAGELKTQPSIMKLQIYALNFLIQYWMVTEALPTSELIQLLQQYQRENDLNFKNTKQFPHFTKIIKYFPNVLLDAEGLINIA